MTRDPAVQKNSEPPREHSGAKPGDRAVRSVRMNHPRSIIAAPVATTDPGSGAAPEGNDGGTGAAHCIGFGEHESTCTNEAGTKWSKLWCLRCDRLRRAHISAQMEKIGARFAQEATRG